VVSKAAVCRFGGKRRKKPAIAWFLTEGAEPKLEGMGYIPCFVPRKIGAERRKKTVNEVNLLSCWGRGDKTEGMGYIPCFGSRGR